MRELENVIERAVILSNSDKLRLDEVLDPDAAMASRTNSPQTLEDVERAHILSILDETGWKIQGTSSAAQLLDLHPNTLRSRMKKLGITRSSR